MKLDHAVTLEKDGFLYLVGPVAPFEPSDEELAAFSFDAKTFAPNEKIGWLRGQYVEAGRPNANGAEWSGEDLAIKSLTPRLMPVTVMHDFNANVGVIADTRLLTPEQASVPRARIDTSLAIWRHRFPDIWEEVADNYRQGLLMQSMECLPAWYECGDCGKRFPKLPGGAEQANWCSHLLGETAAENGIPVRRLGDVTFTGTGLIFGTRGSEGAYDEGHLEVLAEEVAEFHARAKGSGARKQQPKRHRRGIVEIEDSKYQELVQKAARADDLERKVNDLEETAAKVPDLERKVDQLEIDKKAASDKADEEKARADRLAEEQAAASLAKDRTGKLGTVFLGKLPESVKTRLLDEQARKLSDADWTARVEELAEMVGVEKDKIGEAAPEGDGVTAEEVALSGAGHRNDDRGNASSQTGQEARQRAVVGGLMKVL